MKKLYGMYEEYHEPEISKEWIKESICNLLDDFDENKLDIDWESLQVIVKGWITIQTPRSLAEGAPYWTIGIKFMAEETKAEPKYVVHRSDYSKIDGEWIEKRYKEGNLLDHPKER